MGTVAVKISSDDPLLDRSIEPALAHATHVDSVTVLPPGARVLATTELDPNAALRFGERAWGVQFHPEFDAAVMREYIETRGRRISPMNIPGEPDDIAFAALYLASPAAKFVTGIVMRPNGGSNMPW